MVITEFTGDYAFMSNNYISPMKIGYDTYLCVESAYQALRSKDAGFIPLFRDVSGMEARRLGKYMTERNNWDDIKYEVLYRLTLEKFKQNYILADKLISTGDAYIQCEVMGDILMRVREQMDTPLIQVANYN